jgi:hypothetical protein
MDPCMSASRAVAPPPPLLGAQVAACIVFVAVVCTLLLCRVDAVQQALVCVTGISVPDQIVMCHGARLDPAKPLAAYKLPVVSVWTGGGAAAAAVQGTLVAGCLMMSMLRDGDSTAGSPLVLTPPPPPPRLPTTHAMRAPAMPLDSTTPRQRTPCMTSCIQHTAVPNLMCLALPFPVRRQMPMQLRTPLCFCTTSCTCALQLRRHLRSHCLSLR